MTLDGTPQFGPVSNLTDRYAHSNGPLVRLSYVSRRLPSASDETMINVFLNAAVRNFLAGVSGQVWISARHFVQTLEGTAGTVEGIYRRISSDSRHADITCITRSRADTRSFVRPITWNRVHDEKWAVVGVPVMEDAIPFDDACETLILRHPASPR